jgi:hypothetical protein
MPAPNDSDDPRAWDPQVWTDINDAVSEECDRIKIAAKFIPVHGPVNSNELTIPADRIRSDSEKPKEEVHNGDNLLDVEPTETTRLVETEVRFTLTKEQVRREKELRTGVTLATRAANLLSQAQDLLIFQGDDARKKHSLFGERDGRGRLIRPGKVNVKSGQTGIGLLKLPEQKDFGAKLDRQSIVVPGTKRPPLPHLEKDILRWREVTFEKISIAYSRLQSGQGLSQAHYGPYALVLHYIPYADTFAPLTNTLIMPADRIKPLVTTTVDGSSVCHYYGTGTLDILAGEDYRGLLISIGGNTMDLVVAQPPITEFLQKDLNGNSVFRVYERFAVREKDATAVIRLEFKGPIAPEVPEPAAA